MKQQINFFSDPQLQQALKKGGKVLALYNNKKGSFLVYPLFKKYNILYTNSQDKNKIEQIASKHNCIYTVIETLKPVATFQQDSFKEFIPRATRQISLSVSLEQILKQMHPKGRYNIKVAQKHGLTVTSKVSMEDFYKLLRKTAKRDNFQINPLKYYKALFDCMPGKKIHLLGCYKDKDLIATAIMYYYKNTAYYFYGASDPHYKKYMAPYLIQFKAIERAKHQGQKVYDFLGISPYSPHPLDKVSEFKRKFGGQVVHFQANHIIVHKKLLFYLLKLRKLLKKFKP